MAERDYHRRASVGHALDRVLEAFDALAESHSGAGFSASRSYAALTEIRWARAGVEKAARHLAPEIEQAQREVERELREEELALANGLEEDSEEGAEAG